MPFYEAGRKEGDFDRGIERLVAAVLVSPDFLYRAIRGAQPAKAGAEYALTDYELATRLSFFLWNTGPDEELFKLAASRELSKPAVLDAQVTRMLADPKASSLVTNFAMKWLGLDGLDGFKPDEQIYTSFNDSLRQDLVTEAQAFIRSVLLENRPIVEMLTSDRTYLNDRVARHYGIDGRQRRSVPMGDAHRQEPPGTARQRRGPDEDVLSGSHLARPARRVGARKDHRHAADAAAARRGKQSLAARG